MVHFEDLTIWHVTKWLVLVLLCFRDKKGSKNVLPIFKRTSGSNFLFFSRGGRAHLVKSMYLPIAHSSTREPYPLLLCCSEKKGLWEMWFSAGLWQLYLHRNSQTCSAFLVETHSSCHNNDDNDPWLIARSRSPIFNWTRYLQTDHPGPQISEGCMKYDWKKNLQLFVFSLWDECFGLKQGWRDTWMQREVECCLNFYHDALCFWWFQFIDVDKTLEQNTIMFWFRCFL